jgi:Na+/H+-translocating membrane pyrophosphatase
MGESTLYWIIPIAGIAAILFAAYLARDVLARDTGTQAMVDVADTIREGAVAFIRRQYTTIACSPRGLVIGVVIAWWRHRRRGRSRLAGSDRVLPRSPSSSAPAARCSRASSA